MNKIINQFFFYCNLFLLLIAFIVTFYLSLMKMDYYQESIISSLRLFLPFLLVLIIFVINHLFNRGRKNIFFNVTCIIVLLAIIIIDYRVVMDTNMVFDNGSKFNFLYFSFNVTRIKIMLYLTFITDILLLFNKKK